MSRRASQFPSLDKLGDELRRAAHRELQPQGEAARPAGRRRPRRLLVAVAAASLAVAAAAGAGAGDLISIGEPVDNDLLPKDFAAGEATEVPLVVASDPGGGPDFAARPVTATDGQPCVFVGQRKNGELGRVRGGKFVPYGSGANGVCAPFGSEGAFVDTFVVKEPETRTAVFGRARRDAKTVTLTVEGERHTARPGPSGTFLLIFDGRVPKSAVSVRAVARTK